MSKKLVHNPTNVDPELADAQAKLSTAVEAKSNLEKLLQEKVAEVTELKLRVNDAEKRAVSAEDNAKAVMPLRRECEDLKKTNQKLQISADEEESKRLAMEKQLGIAMDGTVRMQKEVQSAQSESKKLAAQLNAALRDLTSAEETIEKERAEKVKVEERKTRAEKALEDLMMQMQENSRDVDAAVKWNTASQLWMTATLTAAGTASVVSLLFMKYYSKL